MLITMNPSINHNDARHYNFGRLQFFVCGTPGKGKSYIIQSLINSIEARKEENFQIALRWIRCNQQKMHRTGRKLEIADTLFDEVEVPFQLSLDQVPAILHYLKCLLASLLFTISSTYPETIRPRCTTMPWTIWPALVVLWGVCWMFYSPGSVAPAGYNNALDTEIDDTFQG
jgi:hypothetical protein